MNKDAEIPWLRNVPPEEMRRTVDALYRVHYLISAVTDLNSLLERIMQESKTVARAEACSLMLYEKATQELFFEIAQGETGDQQALKKCVRLKLGQGIAGTAAENRSSINVRDVETDARFYSEADSISRFKTRNLMAVPLVDRQELVGVVEVVNKIGEPAFSETDLHVLEIFSSLAATAIVNARLIEKNIANARMAAIGQAVAGLSHYTKNIITGMMGGSDLIDQALCMKDLALIERAWPVFRKSTGRISEIVQDMLSLSKDRQPNFEPCDIPDLLSDATQTFSGLLAKKSIGLSVNCSVRQNIQADRAALFRCLLNLLTNAADAAPEKNGLIAINAWQDEDERLFMEIHDNGPGIPLANRGRIFEPFFSTKGSQGTGLGLAVTHKIVKEHSGSIVVESGPEGGALFRIIIPPRKPRLP